MNVLEVQALVNFYTQKGFHRHVQSLCKDVLKKRPNEPTLMFWRAFAIAAEGNTSDSIRELEELQGKPDVALAVASCLVQTHKSAKYKDDEAINKLKGEVQQYSKTTDPAMLLNAGLYFWHAGKHSNAKQCFERILADNPNEIQALAMLGWVELTGGNPGSKHERKAVMLFNQALGCGGADDGGDVAIGPNGLAKPVMHDEKNAEHIKHLEALLGRAAYFERSKRLTHAVDDLNKAIVFFPWFLPALTEKARLLLMLGQWDEALDSAQRVLTQDPQNIDALRVVVMYLLARESRPTVAATRLGELMDAIDRHEPSNPRLFYDVARPCTRLASGKRAILERTLAFLDRAVKLESSSSEFLTEAAYHFFLLGDLETALRLYTDAVQFDETNVQALTGMIRVTLSQGNYADAEQRLQFLTAIEQSIGRSSELLALQALLALRKYKDEARALQLLDESVDEHFTALKNAGAGYAFYVQYNPEFLVLLVAEYMKTLGTDPIHPGDAPPKALVRAQFILEHLCRTVPGMLEPQLLLARAQFLAHNFEAVDRALTVCARLDPQCADIYLIQAQRSAADQNFKQCTVALEQALSLRFEVRQTPVYHLLKARVLDAQGQSEEAMKLVDEALSLPGVRRAEESKGKAGQSSDKTSAQLAVGVGVAAILAGSGSGSSVQLGDRVAVFLLAIQLAAKLGRPADASKLLNEARAEFGSTSEAPRIILCEAENLVQKGEHEAALQMLRNVPELSVHHTRSRIAASEIYLRHAKNRIAYAACFADLASKPGASVQAHVLLGEALMRIQEPDRAIRAYEDALKLAPSDATLASKIGRALVTTHDFGRAVRYYESAVAADPSRSALFHELIELLVKLGRLEEAGAKLRERRAMLPKGAAGVEDVHALIAEVRSCLLLARVHKHGGFSAAAASTPAQGSRGAQDEAYGAALTDAWNAQKDVLRLAKGRDADLAARERDTAASIACQMAQYYQQQRRDPEQALGFYSEALKLNENHAVALLAMANLQSQAGEVDRALQTTQTLLRVDPANEEASALLADLLFRKGDHELAIGSFKALLERKSDHYSVLQRLIHLLRRAGRLADATRFLKAAAKSSARAEFDAGLHYCQGLHAWYSNDAREALKELNQARKDVVWGSQALQHMIEIYLNPDNQALFAQEVEGATESNSEALPASSAENIKAAEKLLKELTAVLGPEGAARITILDAYIQMASGQKAWIEQAIRNFSTVLSSDPDNVPALLGQSHGFMLLKQQPKARNNLKRIAKMPVTSEHSEEFERSFLLLSDIYVEVGKYDLAAELCKKCIANNKSCAKAWEYLGVIMEKENAFKDAADHYERAWSLQNETSASVGFKLAFNYLKAKRYVEAIGICNKVLALFPDYPKIRKEILDKARVALRP